MSYWQAAQLLLKTSCPTLEPACTDCAHLRGGYYSCSLLCSPQGCCLQGAFPRQNLKLASVSDDCSSAVAVWTLRADACGAWLPGQDCNLVTYDKNGTNIFQSATTVALDNYAVTPPCRTVVEGAGGGFIAIVDSFASGDQSDTVLFTRPYVGNGIMLEGQALPQVLRPAHPAVPGAQPCMRTRAAWATAWLAGWDVCGRQGVPCGVPHALGLG